MTIRKDSPKAHRHEGTEAMLALVAFVPQCLRAFGFVVFALIVSATAADSITFVGTTIPLRECTIEAIQGGHIFWVDSRGQRQRRGLEEVSALSFDGLAELDQAEQAIGGAREDYDGGIRQLLKALLKTQATPPMQKLWIHARLARVHDIRGENIQSAGHAAAAMMLSDDPFWRSLVPTNSVHEPSYAAAKESYDNLLAALRPPAPPVKNAELRAAIERMLQQVQPVYERLAKSYTGPPIAPGSTVSGFLKQEILKDDAEPDQPDVPAFPAGSVPALPATERTSGSEKPVSKNTPDSENQGAARAPSIPEVPPVIDITAATDVDSPKAIDALLAQKNWSEALARCERIAQRPGDRDLAHFLFQYGSALSRAGGGRYADAAVMFTRCSILFPDSSDAAHSLIQTAILYRDHFQQPETFRRLLQQALDQATMLGHDSAAMLARELLNEGSKP